MSKRTPEVYFVDFNKEVKEDPSRCIKAVPNSNGWHEYQCRLKRGYGKDGLYCKQHARRHPA